MDKAVTSVIAVLTAIIAVAIVAVVVSKRSSTPQVLQSAGTAFSGIITTALGPILNTGGVGSGSLTGGSQLPSLTYL